MRNGLRIGLATLLGAAFTAPAAAKPVLVTYIGMTASNSGLSGTAFPYNPPNIFRNSPITLAFLYDDTDPMDGVSHFGPGVSNLVGGTFFGVNDPIILAQTIISTTEGNVTFTQDGNYYSQVAQQVNSNYNNITTSAIALGNYCVTYDVAGNSFCFPRASFYASVGSPGTIPFVTTDLGAPLRYFPQPDRTDGLVSFNDSTPTNFPDFPNTLVMPFSITCVTVTPGGTMPSAPQSCGTVAAPEPAALALFGVGVAGAAAMRRRRRA